MRFSHSASGVNDSQSASDAAQGSVCAHCIRRLAPTATESVSKSCIHDFRMLIMVKNVNVILKTSQATSGEECYGQEEMKSFFSVPGSRSAARHRYPSPVDGTPPTLSMYVL